MFRTVVIAVGAAGLLAASSTMADGKAVYDTKCAACHAAGVANAPKLGDKAAWAPRVKLGVDAMVQTVVKGKNAMPPRAGQNVNDADIKAGVEYMFSKVK